jgi:hypothetical protein
MTGPRGEDSMEPRPIRALLAGENARRFTFLGQRLENRGCLCLFASCSSEAEQITGENGFDF